MLMFYNFNLNVASVLYSFERMSYYGLRAILIIYLVNILNIEDAKAQELFGGYATLSLLTTLLGGYIADNFIGSKRTIVIGSIMILIGHILLYIENTNITNIVLALSAISLGTGLFKPCAYTAAGEVFKDDHDKKTKGYRYFHVFFNALIFPGVLLSGYVYEIKPEYGFSLALFTMLFAFIVLFTCWDYINEPEKHDHLKDKNYYAIIWTIICLIIIYLQHFILLNWSLFQILYNAFAICMAYYIYYLISIQPTQKEKNNIILIIFFVIVMCLAMALETQISKVLLLFADRNVNLDLGCVVLSPVYFDAIDPFTVLTIGSIITYYSRNESTNTSTSKLFYTYFFIFLGYILLYFACFTYDENYNISAIYLLIAIMLIITSQIIVLPFILSITNSLAPKNYTTFFSGILCYGLSFSRYLAILISKVAAVPETIDRTDNSITLFIYQGFFLKLAGITIILLILSILIFNYTSLKDVANTTKLHNIKN